MKSFGPLLHFKAAALCCASLLACSIKAQSYTIPVVFHVLYVNPIGNISDDQIMDGLNILNQRFNEAGDTLTVPYFASIAASMDIEFCLASIAPDGSATTGIERTQTPWAMHGGVPESYMNPWPREKYLNIWVVNNYESGVFEQSAYSPEQADTMAAKDGIMILHDYVGSIGTSSQLVANSLVFMAGRYLGLKLLWEVPTGQGDCGDDDVADTPPCEPIYDCDLDLPSCEPGIPANVQNIMSYSYCTNMFSQGQKDRVYAALNSPLAQRNNLWTAANLALTGCGPLAVEDHDLGFALQLETMAEPGKWIVHFPGASLVEIVVFDASGRTVRNWQTTGTDAAIDLSNQAPGMYMLRVLDRQGRTSSRKLVML